MRILALTTALVLAGSGAMAQDLTGHYRVKGTNLDGSIYEGEAQITATSEFTIDAKTLLPRLILPVVS